MGYSDEAFQHVIFWKNSIDNSPKSIVGLNRKSISSILGFIFFSAFMSTGFQGEICNMSTVCYEIKVFSKEI